MKAGKKNILLKAYLVSFAMVLVAIGIAYHLFALQHTPAVREKLTEWAKNTNFKEAVIPAQRGNLYASDGSLLATSVRFFDVAIDGKSMRQNLIDTQLNALADSLSDLLGKSPKHYAKLILDAKAKNKQYVLIARNLNYKELSRLKTFPIFNKGRIKGGLSISDTLKRERSIKDIGKRTLGYVKNDSIKVGLEGAYNSLLAGKNGKRLVQRMGGGNWKPINISTEVNAQDGFDVVTTIDIGLQNVAYNSLLNQLTEYEADHGSIVVMEVATGEVKAIANLTRLPGGDYADIQNFAVGEANEPGSTIKTISLLAALKTGVVDTSTLVATGRGRAKLFGRVITDSHGNGTINVKQVLEKSSNIGTAKIITSHFQKDPEEFLDVITKDWKMGEKLDVDIPGEAQPFFPDPSAKSWSKQSLSSVSFGYESKLTPLQLLTFYNGIANNGVMLKPLFVKEIKDKGVLIEKFKPQVRVAKMAPDSVIGKIQAMLAGVVKKGTGRSLYSADFPAAGKTGTARAEYWKKGPMQYRASFCGYFPADNPKYSCIVVVHKPSRKKGFYGSSVAGPVFKSIMNYVYLNTPQVFHPQNVKKNQPIKPLENESIQIKNSIPNLVGKEGYKVVPSLENAGLKVSFSGIGRVVSQSIPAGRKFKKGETIHLVLSNS